MSTSTFEKRYINVGFWVLFALVLFMAAQMLLPFVAALLGGAVLAVLAYPFFLKLRKKFKPFQSALLTVGGSIVVIALPLTLVGTLVTLQLKTIVDDFQESHVSSQSQTRTPVAVAPPTEEAEAQSTVTQNSNAIPQEVLDQLDGFVAPLAKQVGAEFTPSEWIMENKAQLSRSLGSMLGKFGVQTGIGLVLLTMAFLSMFFMVKDGDKLYEPALKVMPLPREKAVQLFDRLRDTVVAVFMGVIVVATIQGTLATIGYAIAGVPAWLVWGAATVVCAAIPVLGAPVIYIPVVIVLISQGRVVPGVILLAFCALLVSNVDNLLRPKYIGERLGHHYLVVFFSLLGGLLAYGPIGLMLGPCVATAFLCLVEVIMACRDSGSSLADSESNNALDPAEVAPGS